MLFRVDAVNPVNHDDRKSFWYDNETSALLNPDMTRFITPEKKEYKKAFAVSKDTPRGKDRNLKVLKISLGLSCNYACEYCSQRFVPHEGETNQKSIEPFLDQLPSWFKGGDDGRGTGVRIEFWGGEPFVYWKTMKPLAEHLREKYPNVQMSVITNGSLLDAEKNEWLDKMGFTVSISHDAVGQHVRGPDPLDDPKSREAIFDLYRRLGPKKRFSFNSMIHSGNQSRTAVVEFFQKLTGNPDIAIGQGEFIDAYDEGGLSTSLKDPAESLAYRNLALSEGRNGKLTHMLVPREKILGFIDSLTEGRPSSALGQKCGMDRPEQMTVDLNGNVITCQNVSAQATAPNGESHKIGHVDQFDDIALNTATHWSHREDCQKCPVLQLCQGSCMFLQGPLWDASCENSFSDNIVYFSLAFEMLTGYVPTYIDGPQREDRKDIFGLINGVPETPKKKPFPIPVITV